jgi:hypothetical protein
MKSLVQTLCLVTQIPQIQILGTPTVMKLIFLTLIDQE